MYRGLFTPRTNLAQVFLYEALVVPFEISALSLVVTFWTDKIPIWAIVLICIVLYAHVSQLT